MIKLIEVSFFGNKQSVSKSLSVLSRKNFFMFDSQYTYNRTTHVLLTSLKGIAASQLSNEYTYTS